MNNLQEKRERLLSMIADWQQRGKSKKAYCAENGINEATFYYWFSRMKENDTATRGSFIIIDKVLGKNDVEIIYPNCVRIKIENDIALISQLIRLY
ncbi:MULTISPECIES: IS66 family insertion sequence element accessory protein TnpA [Sphingobacterium]|uniref:IS66 family insertion sequence element accessory protein TnpA n=1 Tax=Sphingobacterium TaxID=28453 RepID=UPI00258005BF|nr:MULTISPECIES: IS66 family insertion sequence element accessory protein TnpB [Sphingobacterium]